MADLLEDAVRMNQSALQRHGITIVKDYQHTPLITVEKHKGVADSGQLDAQRQASVRGVGGTRSRSRCGCWRKRNVSPSLSGIMGWGFRRRI